MTLLRQQQARAACGSRVLADVSAAIRHDLYYTGGWSWSTTGAGDTGTVLLLLHYHDVCVPHRNTQVVDMVS